MKMKYFAAFSAAMMLMGFGTYGQTLFSYGKHDVSVQEFKNVYEKNSSSKTLKKTTVPDYIELYALYKMKVQEALDLHLDTAATVKKELDGYKQQLTESMLTDKEVTSKLVEEAYERMKKDINVSHLLIAVKPGSNEHKAELLIDSLYQVLQQGKATFANLVKKYSDDQTTISQEGNIGYITALQTPYAFENVAYSTPKGAISKPFRTDFGFHILKVEDIRNNPGKVQVQQILIASPKFKGEEAKKEALQTANTVLKKLKAGAKFEDMVKEYSGDKFTKNNNGLMDPFDIGAMTPAFEKAAFALNKPGDLSQLVETDFGYHILKLVKKIPLKPLDSVRFDLTAQIKNDPREQIAKDAYINRVKNNYNFMFNPGNYQQMVDLIATDTYKDLNPERYPTLNKKLFELAAEEYTQQDFLQYASKLVKGNFVGNREQVLRDLYRSYENDVISKLQQEELLKSDPHLAGLIQEYRNSILLFELMDKKVWSKATEDFEGQKVYFGQNRSKYKWEPGFEGSVFYSENKMAMQSLSDYLNQGQTIQEALEKVSKELNYQADILPNSSRYSFTQFPLNKNVYKAGKATTVFKTDDAARPYGVIYADKLYPKAEDKTIEEAKGYLVADYQDYLEKKWEADLRQRFPLTVNKTEEMVLEKEYK